MNDVVLKDIREIYGCKKSPEPLSIKISGGLIEKIAPFDDLGNHRDNTEVIESSGFTVIPGFVESHTHLLFAGSREDELYMRAAGTPYLEILKRGGGIYNTVQAVRRASEQQLIESGLKFLDQALGFGITTIEIKSGYGLDFENEEKMLKVINKLDKMHPVDIVPTFLVHTVPKDADRQEYLDGVVSEMIPEFRKYAEWFDIFLEKNVFTPEEAELLILAAKDKGYKIGIHTNQVNDIGGVALAEKLGIRHVDHLEVLSDSDAERIRKNNIYSVFLPCAEGLVFSEHTGQIKKLSERPDLIVLSSDFNPGSSPVLSPYFVMSYAVMRYRISDPELLIDAYTKNPAHMLMLEKTGEIKEGFNADLVCLDLDNIRQIPYFGSFDIVRYIIKKGRLFSRKEGKFRN
ncbi:imidazolonepropionase [candidate division KSB1 bacterium]|nr:MAG: imidazolonepropionase [candidate division KSB1 bacterium]